MLKLTRKSINGEYREFNKIRGNVPQKSRKTVDYMEFVLVENDKNTIELAKKIGRGVPLVLNFEGLETKAANKMLFFLSGVMFPLGGEVIEIKERIYLFASHENLQDNSLKEFVASYR